MPRILAVFVLMFEVFAAPLSHAVDVPALTDLHADLTEMQQRKLPMILLFHSHGCGYCHYVMEDHLKPMILSGQYRNRALIRQLEERSGELVDQDGQVVDARDLTRRYKVRFFPTLLILGPDGRVLAEPLVGVANIDLYGSQLESALQKAESALKR